MVGYPTSVRVNTAQQGDPQNVLPSLANTCCMFMTVYVYMYTHKQVHIKIASMAQMSIHIQVTQIRACRLTGMVISNHTQYTNIGKIQTNTTFTNIRHIHTNVTNTHVMPIETY